VPARPWSRNTDYNAHRRRRNRLVKRTFSAPPPGELASPKSSPPEMARGSRNESPGITGLYRRWPSKGPFRDGTPRSTRPIVRTFAPPRESRQEAVSFPRAGRRSIKKCRTPERQTVTASPAWPGGPPHAISGTSVSTGRRS